MATVLDELERLHKGYHECYGGLSTINMARNLYLDAVDEVFPSLLAAARALEYIASDYIYWEDDRGHLEHYRISARAALAPLLKEVGR